MTADAKFFRATRLRNLREIEQVAAICYRVRGDEIEFLLVQTGGGRWIFPKGGVEPGLTHAQAAAMEAFEEAGVHGRMEENPLTQYRTRRSGKQGVRKQTVSAHLCEVLRLGPPQETGRNRTWFTIIKAERYLREDRKQEDAAELLRVVRRAVARIKQTQNHAKRIGESSGLRQDDPLHQVRLEATIGHQPGIEATYQRFIRRLPEPEHQLTDRNLAPTHLGRPVRQLRAAFARAAVLQNVTAIDQARGRDKARR